MLWTFLSIVILVLAIPALFYIPAVQEFAKDYAIKEVRKSTGMDIALNRLSLKFPLNLQLDGLTVIEATGDTMVTARSADIDVALTPLLRGKIKVRGAQLDHATYRLGTPDSAMFLTARIDRFNLDGSDLNFAFSRIDIGRAILDGGDITLILKDTTTVTPPDTTASAPIAIKASDIQLRNLRFRMSMLPVIDSLGTFIRSARLIDGTVDTGTKRIGVNTLAIDSAAVTYLTPDAAYLASHPADTTAISDTITAAPDSAPWVITAAHLSLTSPGALYAMRGARPLKGFDPSYIQASGIALEIDSFYNRGTDIRVPIRRFDATERCGIVLNASGTFSMDSSAMYARDFNLSTLFSRLSLDAAMGIGNLATDPTLPLRLKTDGIISLTDVDMFMPSASAYTRDIPKSAGMTLSADIHGTSGDLDIAQLSLQLPRHLRIEAKGSIRNPMDFNRMDGRLDIDGSLQNVNFVKPTLLDVKMARNVNIPPTSIKGTVIYRPGNIDGDITMRTGQGRMALDARWNSRAQGYDAALSLSDFPVASFMPSLGIGDITMDAKVRGQGYNPENRRTHMTADIHLGSVMLNKQQFKDISLQATLDTCRVDGTLSSHNPGAYLDAGFSALLLPEGYRWDFSGDIHQLDIALLMPDTPAPMHGSLGLYSNGFYNPRTGEIDAALDIDRLDWTMPDATLQAPSIDLTLASDDSITHATLASGDLTADFTALCSLDSVISRLSRTSVILNRQIADKSADIRQLQASLPQLALSLRAGSKNVAASYLAATSGITFRNASLSLHNDSLIALQSAVSGLATGSMKLDEITFDANQHGRFLVYKVAVDNKPGTMDNFAHVNLSGYLADDKVSAMLRQSNIKGDQGFHIGVNAAISDSTLNVKFVPYKPTIAYKNWTINPDNNVAFNYRTKHLDANLKLMSDSSSLHLYTLHTPDSTFHGQEDVILQLANIKLSEWLSISPFAPPVKGVVDADLRFRWDKDEITGNGSVDLDNLYYGRDRVGSFTLNLDVANENRSKALHANVSLLVDSVEVITATGALNDSTARNPFLLDFNMIHFPLRVVNPFLPKDMAQLSGMLNGRMDITGNIANPIFNGYLDFDSTAVKLGMTGASYRFSEEKIPVDSNIVRFNDFTISGLNRNDLHVNGTVDARHLTDIRLDLGMKASDMQIVNSSRARGGASVYGKAFIDLDATVRGNMQLLRVNADLNLLGGTNVTYVMTDAEQKLAPQANGDMVRFVQFSDTTQVADADSIAAPSFAMILDADLTISEGSTINVDLSTDGKNKVSVAGSGNFSYNLTPMNGTGRITGRYTINSGFIRYTPQISTGGISMSIMSEKNFKFIDGSYIAFNGDLLNPTLNVKAVERLKANVTQSGQNSRLVNFDISLAVTNTLENMNVAFDLSTDDDITIQNELQSMSPEQRANQAMNMLLYNQYTGPGTKANANLSGNPLYSFLASQINSWAANNIRGVDISFGIDQYDTTTDGAKSTTTSYSYRVSKTLFNDRFKIVVGGNYSTDADADENFSQNLINDISFEYMLNRSGSMYVRLFRHVGFESILEGEITQTGVGFVLKRKINSLRDIFRRSKRTKVPQPVQPANTAADENVNSK